MKRNQPRRGRAGNTLHDALSENEREQLLGLRGALEKTAEESFQRQIAETRPSRRRPSKPALPTHTAPVQRPFTKKSHQAASVPPPPKPPNQANQNSIPSFRSAPRLPEPEFEYWDFPHEAPTREPPPLLISGHDREGFADVLRTGTNRPPTNGEELFIVLGIDLGTSSTKMIVRLPTAAGTPTVAIPAPEPCCVTNEPYLWRTLLWLQEDGTFFPWPEPGTAVLNTLKQGLIQQRSDTVIPATAALFPVSGAEAGAAYLAYAIQYAKGWLIRNRPNLLLRRQPVWFLNLGIPAASYDDMQIVDPFRRVGATALELSTAGSPITAQAVRAMLNDRRMMNAGMSKKKAEELGVAVFPETAAETTGFAKSARGAPGLYLLVDVGAMTLDACMFRLKADPDGNSEFYAFMAAAVRPLGVESFHWFLDEGKTESQFVEQCNRMLWGVAWPTKSRRDPNATGWMGSHAIPVFLTGGGAAHSLHRNVVKSLDPWMKQFARNDGIRFLELPVPDSIDLPLPLPSFGRMAVAWGLSYPHTEIGTIWAMRDVEDVAPPTRVDWDAHYVSKDQV